MPALSSECAVCLEEYTEPVCIPCGHLYCMKCVAEVVRYGGGNFGKCPTCKRDFNLFIPDATFVPEAFKPFLLSPIRRIYAPESLDKEREDTTPFKDKIKELEASVSEERDRVFQLEATLEADTRAIDDLEAEVKEMKKDGKVREREARRKARELNKALQESKRLEEEIEKLKEANAALNSTNEELTEEIESYNVRRWGPSIKSESDSDSDLEIIQCKYKAPTARVSRSQKRNLWDASDNEDSDDSVVEIPDPRPSAKRIKLSMPGVRR
ncbi:hypothetical protein DFP72DRAFT_930548 [Ephemerocybe angulata]|uniref:RING-type domain-containing protein n=1 Tax=Ephemerocybe angulata TaxID=980116 RepID=A0A8H6HD52_9AGAR|nr:hypothetical protein DFP72DRAFT_930548 [Tulosesus angulatus]